MDKAQPAALEAILRRCDPTRPVLIAGPTASGKSALALAIAQAQGGVVVNADAIQVFDDWRVLTARPSAEEEARAPHALYGHIPGAQSYSVGDWLREVSDLMPRQRLIITGGTGLYFSALTEGLADIPEIDPQWRCESQALLDRGAIAHLRDDLDARTAERIDLANPRRVQRAWEVLMATGRGLADWQADTPPPLLPIFQAQPFVLDAPRDWLNPRIARRFHAMVMAKGGALDEARANHPTWSRDLPSAKAIGAAELMAHLDGKITLDQTIERASILTRQFAKRQRTWFRARMSNWPRLSAPELATALV